ncbi:hypothetical protein QO001_006465 [Methylobacterium brachiatum]|uniref:Uncharacterized protein n=1 Tax=Methylobacterium brachiatum TaxID=269660 RepID=A0AAJ1TYV7_9HYPH|nr:hypothetical protein [Methylobacterium brachiatum]MCB4806581.1 hypothetical protein [Methylobacterium brachiatum]MDQ0547506.1 hypothetical protein [Methylobacterium brachiatum]
MIVFTISVDPSCKSHVYRIADGLEAEGLRDVKIFPKFNEIVGHARVGIEPALASVEGVQTVRWSQEFMLRGEHP